MERGRNIGVTYNGPCNKLRKQRNIGGKVDEIPLGFGRTPCDIHRVAQDLEGVKRDADGKRELKQRERSTERVQVADEKICILKQQQRRKGKANGGNEERLACARPPEPLDQKAVNITGKHA